MSSDSPRTKVYGSDIQRSPLVNDDYSNSPRTAAGRRLLSGPNMKRALLSDILAIEAEARRDAVTEAAQDWMRRAAEKRVASPAASGEAQVLRNRLLSQLPSDYRPMLDELLALAATPPLPEGLDVLDDEALVNRLEELESQKQAVHDEVRRRLQQPDREGA